jgi:hypothetical protein
MTTHPEQTSGWEPAPEDRVTKLYETTTDLLKKNGNFGLHESSDIHGTHMGLPVTDVPPNYGLTIPLNKIQGISPQAAEALGLSGDMEITFWEPCYIRTNSGVLDYQVPNCVFDIPQADNSPYKKISLVIDAVDDEHHKTWRWQDTRAPAPTSERVFSFHDLAAQLLEERKLEEQTGAHLITTEECGILQEIIDDQIKNLQSN